MSQLNDRIIDSESHKLLSSTVFYSFLLDLSNRLEINIISSVYFSVISWGVYLWGVLPSTVSWADVSTWLLVRYGINWHTCACGPASNFVIRTNMKVCPCTCYDSLFERAK